MNANMYSLMVDGTVKHFVAKDGRATFRTLLSKVYRLHHVYQSVGDTGCFVAGTSNKNTQEENYFVWKNYKQYLPNEVTGNTVDKARAAMIANVSETIEI